MIRLTFQSILTGVITAANFGNQYSRDKGDCLCYDAYTHSTYVGGDKQHETEVELKVGDKLRTVVDISTRKVGWFVNGEIIAEESIPESIAAQ